MATAGQNPSPDQAMAALQSALERIAALETEVSSQRTRAEAWKDRWPSNAQH